MHQLTRRPFPSKHLPQKPRGGGGGSSTPKPSCPSGATEARKRRATKLRTFRPPTEAGAVLQPFGSHRDRQVTAELGSGPNRPRPALQEAEPGAAGAGPTLTFVLFCWFCTRPCAQTFVADGPGFRGNSSKSQGSPCFGRVPHGAVSMPWPLLVSSRRALGRGGSAKSQEPATATGCISRQSPWPKLSLRHTQHVVVCSAKERFLSQASDAARWPCLRPKLTSTRLPGACPSGSALGRGEKQDTL